MFFFRRGSQSHSQRLDQTITLYARLWNNFVNIFAKPLVITNTTPRYGWDLGYLTSCCLSLFTSNDNSTFCGKKTAMCETVLWLVVKIWHLSQVKLCIWRHQLQKVYTLWVKKTKIIQIFCFITAITEKFGKFFFVIHTCISKIMQWLLL